MASGETLVVWTATGNVPPGTLPATFDLRNNHAVLDYDASTDEVGLFESVMPRYYGGGGITATIIWMASSATSGSVRWEMAFERHQDETTDLDTDDFATAKTVDSTAPATNGAPQYASIAFSNGAEIDSIAVGESFRVRLKRLGSNANDTMLGDAELMRIELKET